MLIFVSGLVLTSSISGRNACLSEEVTFTCTAQGDAIFWGNEAFGELTMHYTSPPFRGEFRAKIVSYELLGFLSELSCNFVAHAWTDSLKTCATPTS